MRGRGGAEVPMASGAGGATNCISTGEQKVVGAEEVWGAGVRGTCGGGHLLAGWPMAAGVLRGGMPGGVEEKYIKVKKPHHSARSDGASLH